MDICCFRLFWDSHQLQRKKCSPSVTVKTMPEGGMQPGHLYTAHPCHTLRKGETRRSGYDYKFNMMNIASTSCLLLPRVPVCLSKASRYLIDLPPPPMEMRGDRMYARQGHANAIPWHRPRMCTRIHFILRRVIYTSIQKNREDHGPGRVPPNSLC